MIEGSSHIQNSLMYKYPSSIPLHSTSALNCLYSAKYLSPIQFMAFFECIDELESRFKLVGGDRRVFTYPE